MLWSCILLSLCVHFSLVSAQVNGRLEVFLANYTNPLGVTSTGVCCGGGKPPCLAPCRTRARLCLTVRYSLPSTGPLPLCELADILTDTLGSNSFSGQREFRLSPVAWPGFFTLGIDLLHFSETSDPGSVILRATVREESIMTDGNWTTVIRGDNPSLTFSYRFQCDLHYYGYNCGKFCQPRNDTHGHYTCNSQGAIVCHPGYQGEFCQNPVCDCTHGICIGPGKCQCDLGWTGTTCSTCIPLPNCVYGSCRQPFECNCQPSYGGMFCNVDLEWCARNSNPCANGGVCLNQDVTGYNFTCSCPTGTDGFLCERKLFSCTQPDSYCLNGGICATSCLCKEGFYGPRCEFQAKTCADNPCEGRGVCISNFTGYRCVCEEGWDGRHCDVNINDCSASSCLNEGQCVDLVNKYMCVCKRGYSGPRCQLNTDDCNNIECLNGGLCRDRANSMECECPVGFNGNLCQFATNSTTSTTSSPISLSTSTSTLVISTSSALPNKTQSTNYNSSSSTLTFQEILLIAVFGVLLPLLLILGAVFVATYRRFSRTVQTRKSELQVMRENARNHQLAVQMAPMKKLPPSPPPYSHRTIFYTEKPVYHPSHKSSSQSFSVV